MTRRQGEGRQGEGDKVMGDKERGQCNLDLQLTILEEAKS